ncbi:MAG: proteasome component pup2 [Chaenotheca gracillima]|nr:MAG: proteasome component pup2 [Chaenotheca gracillima]
MPVPISRLDYVGQHTRIDEYELDRQTLMDALGCMADYIDNQRQSITVIAVGGAVNTILLQSRQSTRDVDFFGCNISNQQRVLLDEASNYAGRRSKVPLGGQWFNNQTMLWIPPDIHRRVTREALDQNEIVFQKRGLKVVAAPWNYAFCGKMNQLARGTEARPYDIPDAVSFLRHHIQRRGKRPVRGNIVKQWCGEYQKATSDDVMTSINKEYKLRYGESGIIR